MDSPPTARQFGHAIRKKLKELDVEATVKVGTTSFAGLGYGDGCHADVCVERALSVEQSAALHEIEKKFKSIPGGPKFDPDSKLTESTFLIRLTGPDYPFGWVPVPLTDPSTQPTEKI